MWDLALLAAVVASAFVWGMARGTAVCMAVCVPGMLPYIAESPRGARGGAAFGALLCAPRLLIFAALGLVWGVASYTVLSSEAFERAALWTHVVGYIVLGAVIAVIGSGLFLRAAREKDRLRRARIAAAGGVVEGMPAGKDQPVAEGSPGALSSALLRFVPSTRRGERAYVLLWGSILGVACLLEVSVLELGVLGTASGGVAGGTAAAAALGGLAMLAFGAGSSVPVVLASAGFAAYVDTRRTREQLVSLRVTGALVMVAIGLLLVVRYGAAALGL